MHSVVCVKQVPDTSEVSIDPETNTIIREGVPSIINPYDLHGVEAALQLKDKYGGKVTILTMGPPQAETAIKRALSFGADKGILLSDRAFAGSDTLATSYIIAQAIKKIIEEEGVDLIFCGKQAIDGDTAQVGPGIAKRLDLNQLTYVIELDDVNLDKEELRISRKLESGKEVVKAQMPALLTVVKDLNEIRYASLPDMIKGAKAEIEMWGKSDIKLDESKIGLSGSPTQVGRIFPPPQREGGEMISEDGEEPTESAKILVEKLVGIEVIPNK
ncbi:electron transfer flavoprotein subunit beta/FixA family protein [Selenihalanaerobacter shriftii]|uniref:Electron transfer flavoprotein small subunit n=1 Tax=Selenihalanaerobacter shriftii TaxID=142842 RepID=A0A1T4QVI6_9FIRM|nr:electron transfer flavoprotein subunit beta/FixA family protein [Selenihalanaerobacter shriftii]SKA07725.1 electron transfer flavoprotein beta subunit [Selenihalanaerobacter shriftii]